ncbi:MAG: DUF4013 domain-containing protein [DPANN group archaeon]|nr:DUF4013 domain-containing protein [DPANN group archaeon]
MVSYREAFRRPFSDVKNFVIGIVLGMVPIVNFLVLGYTLRCARTAMKSEFKLPEWEDWGKLFINGLLYLLIVIIYFLPVFAVAAIFLGSDFFIAVSGETPSMMGGSIGFGMVLTALVFLLTIYLFPAALVRFAGRENFTDAFTCRVIFAKAFSAEYFKVWAVMMLYYSVLWMVFGRLSFIGTGITGFISGVTTLTALGEIFPKL